MGRRGGGALAVQVLGLIFTLSRGPWLGTFFAIALMVVLVAIFVGRSGIGNMISLLVLAGIISMAILLNPSIESDKDPAPAEGTDAAAPLAEYTMASGAVPEPTRPIGAVAPLAASPLRQPRSSTQHCR